MEYTIRKKNTPINTLINNYLDKKSGKVVASRREIQLRFDYLDWKDQKKILMSFLQAGIADRKWASYKLLSYWDKSFESIMEELWLKYQERELSWPIIRYFPIDYIKQNMETLGAGHNYQDICIRLFGVDGFEMDESKLNEVEILNVYTKTGKHLTNARVMELLMTLIEKICTSEYEDWGYGWNYNSDSKISSIIGTDLMKRAISILEYGNYDKVVHDLNIWNESVLHDEVYNSMIAKLYNHDVLSFYETKTISKECYLKHLKESKDLMIQSAVEEYEKQKESLGEMKESKTIVNSLIDVFRLEIERPLPF